MESAGLGLTALATVELCLKYGPNPQSPISGQLTETSSHRYGPRLCDKYRTFRNAETGFAERLLIFENRWLKVEAQVKFLRKVWEDLPARFQVNFNSILAVINSKLVQANQLLNQTLSREDQRDGNALAVMTKDRFRRAAFTATLQKSIDTTIRDLDQWQQNLLDPTWYQLVLVPGLHVEQQAKETCIDDEVSERTLADLRFLLSKKHESENSAKDVFLSYDAVEKLSSGVEFSKASLGIDKESKEVVLLDRVQIPAGTNRDQSISDVYNLVKFFSSVEPEVFGFLRCRGALKDAEHCDLVFSFPKGQDDPTSLRALLVRENDTYPLNARLNIAQTLARSVMFLHDCQFVHKSLRPENIICFATQREWPDTPYMIGLDRFRLIDARSKRLSDDLWYKDIYRHPNRQGIRPEKDYIMQHDIYSLGVCLLEIGLWRSFQKWEDDSDEPRVNEDLLVKKDFAIKDPRKRAFEVKKQVIRLAEQRLPGSMGRIYTSIVLSCLTCLDAGNTDFGSQDELDDESGILVGVGYVEKVKYSIPIARLLLTQAGTYGNIVHFNLRRCWERKRRLYKQR
ncbi:MAG: hypothetical protein Q9219_003006 [cf. Caloplaca sp. 3 TL-2023]